MPLDPRAQEFLQKLPSVDPAILRSIPVADRRKMSNEMVKQWMGSPQPVAHVDNRTVPGPGGQIPIRVYKPEGKGPFPMLMQFHGGAFWLGSIDTEDGVSRILANGVGCIVVSVDYRLAPEHKFPAAADDCYAATRWVAKNARDLGGDARRIGVWGGSAGGNLAAVVALMARDRRGPSLVCQVLLWPVTNFAFDTPSYREKAGYLLTKEDMEEAWVFYLGSEADGRNPYASPLLADDLSGLPPALVITSEYDPLRDEGQAYADRLRTAGVLVEHKCYEGLLHGNLPFETAEESLRQASAYLRSAFTRPKR